MTASGLDMGDAQGVNSAGSGGYVVRGELHIETTGNCGAVGRFATNI